MITSQQYLDYNKNCPKCPYCGSKMTFWIGFHKITQLVYRCWNCKRQILELKP